MAKEKDRRFELRLTDLERARWRAAAERKGLTLASWIRRQCELAAASADLELQ
jgi:hypothetical protein